MTAVGQVFTDMADAIRSKTGGTSPLYITDMASAIDSIETGDVQTIEVTLSNSKPNVIVTATATNGQGYSAISDSTGVATILVQPGYNYVISASKYESSEQIHIDVGEYAVTLEWTPRYGFAQVDIDTTDSDPYSSCSYPQTVLVNGESVENSCYGFYSQNSQDDFLMNDWATHLLVTGIRPVKSDGQATPTFTDAESTDATQWITGDEYFTEFPFNWLSITNDGTNIRIIFSDNDTQPDSTFQCYAHAKQCDQYSNSDIEQQVQSVSRNAIMDSNDNLYFANQFHIGCFDANGGASGAQVYSKCNTTQNLNIRYAYYFQGANARGNEYDIMSFQQYTYIQALFILIYKSTNCQDQHSQGYATIMNESLSVITTNQPLQTTAFGMQGSVGTAQRNQFFWIHDLWGNIAQFVGGIWNRQQLTLALYYWLPRQSNSRAFDNGWTQQTSYAKQQNMGTQIGTSVTGATGGYIRSVVGTNVGGFAPSSNSSGSQSTYFSDRGRVDTNSSYAFFPYVGGYASGGVGNNGIFYFSLYLNSTGRYEGVGSRLAYRGGSIN